MSPMSDLSGALKKITNRYESNQMGGVILASDGIYNEGISPLYSTYNFPAVYNWYWRHNAKNRCDD